MDWSATPLGPRDAWPPVLRTTVRIVVESQLPMALLWGHELILLYNDAYRVIAADKHPWALGRSTREIWPEVWHINEPVFAAVLERGETILLEDALFRINRTGQLEDAYFTLCYSPVRHDDGRVAGSLVTLIETTRRVREEETLRAERNHVAAAAIRERELLAGVVEHVPVMVTIYDPHLRTFHLNAAMRQVLGWTDEEANTHGLMTLCYPDPAYREEVRRFMESGEPGWREFEISARDGSRVTSSWANVRLSDSTWIGIGLDQRERQRVEAELRQALGEAETGQRLLEALLENIPIGLTIADAPDVRIRAVSRYGRELTGRAPASLEGIAVDHHVENWGVLRADGTPARNEELPLSRATQQGESVRGEEWLLVRTDGRRIPILCSAGPIRGPSGEVLGGVIGWQDITERKQADWALQEREEQLRLIIEATGIGAFDFAPQTGRLEWSAHAKQHFGLPPEANVDYGLFLRGLHPEDRERIDALVQRTLRGEGGGEYTTEYRTVGIEDGVERWLSARGRVTFDEFGAPVRFLGITQDITQQKRDEEALRASEARLQKAMEAPTVGVLFFSLDGTIQGANASFERMSGYRSEELRHLTHWKTLTAPEFWDATALKAAELLARGEVEPYEKQLVRPDGSRWWGLFAPTRLSHDTGGLECLEFIIDITDRKHAEDALRARERLQGLLAKIGEFALEIPTIEQFVVVVGELVAKELGVSRCGFSEVDLDAGTVTVLRDYHSDLASIAGAFPIDRFMEHWLEEGRAGFPVAMEDVSTHPRTADLYRDAFAPIQVRAHLTVPLHRGDTWVANFWASHHDARRWSARDVELMKTVAERVWSYVERIRAEEAVRVANEKLKEADQRKNEFLAVLSHELRNPLAPIRNSVYVLEHARPDGAQARRAREVIDRQVQHMTRLIDDLLDITRIARGKVALQHDRVDLIAVVREVADDLREIFARGGVDLEIRTTRGSLWVEGDRTRLAQVVGNLLHNAAKFTPSGGSTTVHVGTSPDGQAVLGVHDTGAGISEETLRQIFEPFVQAPQTIDRTAGGLGLGLALVKGIVELHGGTVTASSPGLGLGSTFTVTLPLAAPETLPPPLVGHTPRPGARARRVLVVEDNADAAESLREALELGDHEVAMAYSGPEGVEAARTLKPEVILCDIGLPGMDGYSVARTLRADPDPQVRTTFLVALSGYALPEDVAKSRQAGFDWHLAKPATIEAIEQLLADIPVRATPA